MLVWRSFWTLSRGLVPQWCIRESVDDNHSRSIGSNTHQLKLGSQAGGRAIRRGEGGGWGVGWAFMVARGGDGTVFHQAVSQGNRTRATLKALIGIKLRKTPASWSCHAAWTTPTPCQPANVGTDRGACSSWAEASACRPASVLLPAAARCWETACVSRSDSPNACSA